MGLLLLAWWWRLRPLLDNRLHADEALYGYWGLLIGRGVDPLLTTVPVYKPPLLPYLIAGAQALGGGSEFAIRLPGLAAGWLLIPLTGALFRALYADRRGALAAAIGVAMSPFAVLFSATAFTDLPMVALGTAACLAAVRDRPLLAGLLVGLACSAKQTGLAWLPLTAGLLLTARTDAVVRRWGRLALGLLGPLLAVAAWDGARVAAGGRSFWEMGVAGYGGLRLIWPLELWPRLHAWAAVGRYLFVSPLVWLWLAVGTGMLLWQAVRSAPSPTAWADVLTVSFALGYGLLHWLLAFPVWDRYLLPLVPVLAVLLGRVVGRLRSGLVVLLLALLLLPVAVEAAHSRYPVGGDHGAYDGIEQVADYLRGRPAGSVVYQHWLGWHYAYYLFDAPIYRAYWPTPSWLAQDVRAFGGREPRYIVFPAWESSARVEWALAAVGYRLVPVLTTVRRDGSVSFRVYIVRGGMDGETNGETATSGER